jgi:hypothetical protein
MHLPPKPRGDEPRTRAAHIHYLTDLLDPAARDRGREAECEPFRTEPGEVGLVSGLTLAEAEELLDWLENHGCTALRVALGGEGVTVTCLCPPGQRLLRDEGGAVRLLRT